MSQTATISAEAAPIELGCVNSSQSPRLQENHADLGPNTVAGGNSGDSADAGAEGSDEAPPNAQSQAERWNRPKGNIGRLAFAFLSFIIAGMNDAAVGVCPSSVLERKSS